MAEGLPATPCRRSRRRDGRTSHEHHPRTPPGVTQPGPFGGPRPRCILARLSRELRAHPRRPRDGPQNSAAEGLPPCAPLKGHRHEETQARGAAAGCLQRCEFIPGGALDLAAVVAALPRGPSKVPGGGAWTDATPLPRHPRRRARRQRRRRCVWDGVYNPLGGVLSRPRRVARGADRGDAKRHATLAPGATALEMAMQPPQGALRARRRGLCVFWVGTGGSRRSGTAGTPMAPGRVGPRGARFRDLERSPARPGLAPGCRLAVG